MVIKVESSTQIFEFGADPSRGHVECLKNVEVQGVPFEFGAGDPRHSWEGRIDQGGVDGSGGVGFNVGVHWKPIGGRCPLGYGSQEERGTQ